MGIAVCMVIGWLLSAAASVEEASPLAQERGGYYEYKEWETEIKDRGFEMRVRARLVILSPRGDRFAGLGVVQDPFNRIDGLKIRVYDAAGKRVFEKKLKDMQKVCGFGASFMLYTNSCSYSIALPGPGYPYTIEYEYTQQSKSKFFWRQAFLQSYLPVQRATYRLTTKVEQPGHYKVYGLDIEPQVEEDGDKTIYLFESTDIPPVPNEDRMPPEVQYPGRIAFSPHEFRFEDSEYGGFSWREVGNWYRSLAADRYLADEQPAPLPDSDPRELARQAYDRVIDETRYVAVSIGIGGWQPHAAAETRDVGYGDCKDMTTLLVSYLRQAGIEAYPVLIATRGSAVIDPEFPTFNFNHLITAAIIEGDTLWMDPTCNLCPFGLIPDADQNVPVLLVTDTGGVILRTPESTAEENCCIRRTKLEIGEDYRVDLTAEWELSGVPALWLEQMFSYSDDEERRRTLEKLLTAENGGYEISEASVTRQPADSGGKVVVRFTATSQRPVDLVSGVAYVKPAVYRDLIDVQSLDLAKREYPVFLHFPQQMVDEVTVTWPEMISVMSAMAPGADSVACEHGYWRRAGTVEGPSVKVHMEAACYRSVVAVEELPVFTEFIRERQAKEREVIKLITATADGRRE